MRRWADETSDLNMDVEPGREEVRQVATNPSLRRRRHSLAVWSAKTLLAAGRELHVAGHIVGPDRVRGHSPFGHGSDEVVAVSVLLRICSQLTSASADLFKDGRTYAAAALLRQLVEVEYLAWAIETRDRDGERWLRSTKEERESFFKPAKLRQAAEGKFRGKDYGYHCELAGHPVPGANILLDGDVAVGQLLLSDLLGHVGRIWIISLAGLGATTWAVRYSPVRRRCRGGSRRGNGATRWWDSHLRDVLPDIGSQPTEASAILCRRR